MIKARTEMTRDLVTIGHRASLDEAYMTMFTNKFRHLPVTNDQGQIVSIISDRDLQKAMKLQQLEPSVFQLKGVSFPENATVADFMSPNLKSFDLKTDIRHLVQTMLNDKISAVMITKHSEVVGIITTDDMLHLLMKVLEDKPDSDEVIIGDVYTMPLWGRMGQMVSDMGV